MSEPDPEIRAFPPLTTRAGCVTQRMLIIAFVLGYGCGFALPLFVTLPDDQLGYVSAGVGWLGGGIGVLLGLHAARALPDVPPVTDPGRRSAIRWWRAVQIITVAAAVWLLAVAWRVRPDLVLILPLFPVLLLLAAETCAEGLARGLRPVSIPAVLLVAGILPLLSLTAGLIDAANVGRQMPSGSGTVLLGVWIAYAALVIAASVKTLHAGGWFGATRARFR